MTFPIIQALATGVPAQRFSQAEIFDNFLQPLLGLGRNRRARSIFSHAGVEHRHTVVDGGYYVEERQTQERNERYLAEAIPLGEATIRRCLAAAGLGIRDVDDFIVVSCTGFDIPGLDLRLAGALGMRSDLRRTCVLGMGCYGAFPGLLRAREAVMAQPGRRALVLALELCSLHLQMDDSLENTIVSALFGDGAAAALVAMPAGGAAGPQLVDGATLCDYTTFEHMAFQLTNHGFRMSLSAYVPDLLAAKIEDFVDGLLQRNGLRREAIQYWGIHPGSAKILDYVQERLGLADRHLEHSRAVLRDFGNMSSPTVLFVLDDLQRRAKPQPGDLGVLLAFGPGLTMESALLRWP